VNGGCETFRVRGEHWFAANKRLPAGELGFALGAEGVGEVVALGEGITDLVLGSSVTFVGGAFAEYVTLPTATLNRVPLPSPEAVAATISGLTAGCALRHTAKLQRGETVLVTAAAGGTGHFAIQIAKAAGARVIAVCGGERKAALCRELGANLVVDYTATPLSAALDAEFASGGGLDVIYDGVGGETLVAALRHLQPKGRALVVGYIGSYPHTERPEEVPMHDVLQSLFWNGGCLEIEGGRKLIGGVWPGREAVAAEKRRVFDELQSGALRAVVDDSQLFEGLESVADAVEHMLAGKTMGKAVVRIRPFEA
jgi:NADPH:quinone reductase-like Zn-dependent oxidoreductase